MADANLSRQLYQYLCSKVGTEKVVKARRIFFKVNDYFQNNRSVTIEVISSGSKAEGLDLPGSDVDLMLMAKTPVIKTERGALNTEIVELVLDTSTTPPGYAHIEIHQPKDEFSVVLITEKIDILVDSVRVENKEILLNTPFKHMKRYISHDRLSYLYVSHGPSTSYLNEAVDYVFCFRLDEWPVNALEWLYRPRLQDWPPQNLLVDICQEEKSVLLVPIGKKFGSSEDNPCEWRISFSVAEQMLVHSFNHTQILCYAILKILLKQVIEKHHKNLLCSYFMKTLLFWMIEETGSSVWTPNNILKCFQACILRLSFYINLEYFPNFFILQNNMFEGKEWGDSKTKLVCILHDIHTEGINFTLRTEFLRDCIVLKTKTQILKESVIKCHEIDIAVYPLLQYMIPETPISLRPLEQIYYNLIRCKSRLVKSLLFLQFASCCLKIAVETKYATNRSNKYCHLEFKNLMSYFLICSNLNLNGWLPLAGFFYQNKQFNNALKIADFVCLEMPKRINIIKFPYLQDYNAQKYNYVQSKGSTFLQRYKLLCIAPLFIGIQARTVFDGCDFGMNIPFSVCIFDESLCNLGHFIRFLCFYNLHDKVEEIGALQDFQFVLDNATISNQPFPILLCSFISLGKAYTLAQIQIPNRNHIRLRLFAKNFFKKTSFGRMLFNLRRDCRWFLRKVVSIVLNKKCKE